MQIIIPFFVVFIKFITEFANSPNSAMYKILYGFGNTIF